MGTNECKLLGDICDVDGQPIEPNTPLPPISNKNSNDWAPYSNSLQFETAEFLFKKAEMSAGNIDQLCDLWAHSNPGCVPPFINHKDLYDTIDATKLGDVPWESFELKYSGEHPTNIMPWMDQPYEYWFRSARSLVANMLSNPDFDGEFDYSPYRNFLEEDERRYEHLMSSDWAWAQAIRHFFSSCIANEDYDRT